MNLNNVYVGENGRIQLSGTRSGFDSKAIVDALVEAKRAPAVSMENKMEKNSTMLSAFKEMKDLTKAFETSLSNLYGAFSYDKSKNVFDSKISYTSTTNATSTASDPSQLIGIGTKNTAAIGKYEIEIHQTAKAQKTSSDILSVNAGDDLTGTYGTGSFEIGTAKGTTTIEVNAGDSLSTIRDRINNVSEQIGLRASIVSISNGQSALVLTATEEGIANSITTLNDITGNLTQSLGLIDTSLPADPDNPMQFKNLSQNAEDAIVEIDGIQVTRSTNDIDDMIEGVSLDLYKAEPGTIINIEIEQDLNKVKNAIAGFVEAYNNLMTFLNDKTYIDPVTGEAGEESTLLGNTTVSNIKSMMKRIAGGDSQGSFIQTGRDNYNVLAEIGIDLVGPAQSQTDNDINTLTIDEKTLDDALLSNSNELYELFSFKVTTTNPDFNIQSFTKGTKAGTYTIETTASGGQLQSATVNGVANSADVNGDLNTIQANNGTSAQDLKIFYSGNKDNDSSTVTVSVGIAAQMFFEMKSILDEENGVINLEMDKFETENQRYQDRINDIDERLIYTRESLTNRFIAMEAAMSRMQSMQESLDALMQTNDDK